MANEPIKFTYDEKARHLIHPYSTSLLIKKRLLTLTLQYTSFFGFKLKVKCSSNAAYPGVSLFSNRLLTFDIRHYIKQPKLMWDHLNQVLIVLSGCIIPWRRDPLNESSQDSSRKIYFWLGRYGRKSTKWTWTIPDPPCSDAPSQEDNASPVPLRTLATSQAVYFSLI